MNRGRKAQPTQETRASASLAESSPPEEQPVVSVEVALYLLIVAIAAALRFVQLDLWPLLSEDIGDSSSDE